MIMDPTKMLATIWGSGKQGFEGEGGKEGKARGDIKR
jgi:hypothetical protein